jgi:hypothetical protein
MCFPYRLEESSLSEPFHNCQTAHVAGITEPSKGEYYIILGTGHHDCTRWRMTESLLKKIRREINEKLD